MTATIHLTIMDLDTSVARQLGAGRPGAAVVTIRPDTRRPGWLARDLLCATGASSRLLGTTKRDADDRQLVPIWLHAHGVTDVLAVGIEALPAKLLPELIDLVTLAGAQLWLVADHLLPDAHTDVLAHWPVTPCPPASFADRWLDAAPQPACEQTAPAPTQAKPLPSVPHVDFTMFRATCHRQLDPADFAAVDAVWRSVFESARNLFADAPDPRPHLRTVLATAQSPSQAAVTARAVQAAAFLAGWHLGVDLDALHAMDDHSPVAASSDPQTWSTLHAYRQPERQAACVLTLLNCTPTAQTALTMADLDLGTMTLRNGDELISLPPATRPTLAALQLSRLAAGAGPDDPLLARPDGEPMTQRAIADAVGVIRRETGLRLASGQIRRVEITDKTWSQRRGVTATRLVAS